MRKLSLVEISDVAGGAGEAPIIGSISMGNASVTTASPNGKSALFEANGALGGFSNVIVIQL